VKDTFPFGVAVQAYIDPLWEPSRLYQNGPDVSDDEFEEMAKTVTPFQVMDWRRWSKEKCSDFIFKDAVRVYEGDCYLDADWSHACSTGGAVVPPDET
jgi:hypothetical protein